jgi:hypothetical protein
MNKRRSKLMFFFSANVLFLLSIFAFPSLISAQEDISSFVIFDTSGNSKQQTIYVYNQGRL